MIIGSNNTPMQLLRRMPKWIGIRPMHVATRRTNNPKTSVKRKTSAKMKTTIQISIFLYGIFANSKENCLPKYFVMKKENAAAINTAISRYINAKGGMTISHG